MMTEGLSEAGILRLLREQISNGKSLSALARELRVDPATLSRTLNGKTPIGRALVRGLAERHPELKLELALFLLE